MGLNKISVAGTGCAIADLIYNRVSFTSQGFNKYSSRQTGDGGLSPGKLVFTEELEQFAGKSYSEILSDIVGNRPPDKMNVGGPSLVALIHAAQILEREHFDVKFYGMAGNDEFAGQIFSIVHQTPLDISHYKKASNKKTPTTDVFSDPDYDNGHGERTFVNKIGAAWDFNPEQIDAAFFEADIQCYGGTALVPVLHDNLSRLLKRSKQKECLTVVNTVFDFRNQKEHPDKPWPLLDAPDDYKLIDVLIMDCEEALRISGTNSIGTAAHYFAASGVSSFFITNGSNKLVAWSDGRLFKKSEVAEFPVSKQVATDILTKPELKGDTTGCGDNFAGGIITSLAMQLKDTEKGNLNLTEAVSWGISSGGFCCSSVGGTYLEKTRGEKRHAIESIRKTYMDQINNKT